MNGNCQSCKYDHVCVYPYKPCDCRDYMKFQQAPHVMECPDCEGDGFKPYPLTCRTCHGSGIIKEE